MRSVTTRRFKKSATFKKEDLLSSKTGQYRGYLKSRIEFVSSVSHKFLPNTHLYFLIPLFYDDTCHFCNCACYCTKYNILRMSDHIELRDMRSEGVHFKNEYKLMIIKVP